MFNDLASQFTYRFCELAVEFTGDMMSDMPNEYSSFKDAKGCLEDSIIQFSEATLEDYLEDFCATVREMVAKRKIQVSEITFDSEGYKCCKYSIKEVK